MGVGVAFLDAFVLLEIQHTEELRTMEVRLFQFYRIPGKIVGSLELVTALIEVGTNRFAVQRSDVVQEKGGIRDDESYLPTAFAYSFVECFASQGCPALHFVEHFLRGALAVGTSGALSLIHI